MSGQGASEPKWTRAAEAKRARVQAAERVLAQANERVKEAERAFAVARARVSEAEYACGEARKVERIRKSVLASDRKRVSEAERDLDGERGASYGVACASEVARARVRVEEAERAYVEAHAFVNEREHERAQARARLRVEERALMSALKLDHKALVAFKRELTDTATPPKWNKEPREGERCFEKRRASIAHCRAALEVLGGMKIVPRRINQEEVGDGLQRLHVMEAEGAPTWRIRVKTASLLRAITVNVLRHHLQHYSSLVIRLTIGKGDDR
jgi:hypothetical protein